MLNKGAFWGSVENCRNLLNKLKFLLSNTNKRGNYSTSFFQFKDSEDYIKLYDSNIKFQDYELIMNDHSHFQFRHTEDGYSMSYYPRPNQFVNYDDFILDFFKDDISELSIEDVEDFLEDLKDGDYHSEYEQYLLELESINYIIPIRFDYDSQNYQKIFHPYCHIHFGLNNPLRIAVDKFITPYLFLLFILKNFHPNIFFHSDEEGNKSINTSIIVEKKSKSHKVKNTYFDGEDNLIYFT